MDDSTDPETLAELAESLRESFSHIDGVEVKHMDALEAFGGESDERILFRIPTSGATAGVDADQLPDFATIASVNVREDSDHVGIVIN